MPVTARPSNARRAQAQQRPAVEGGRPAKLSTAALDANAERHADDQQRHDNQNATTPHRPSIGTPHRGVNVIRAVDRLTAHPNANVHYELQKRTQYIPGQLQHEFESLANAAIVIQAQIQQQQQEQQLQLQQQQQAALGMNTLMTWQDQYTVPAATQQEVWIPVQDQYAYSDNMSGSAPTPTASGGYPTPSHFNANAKPFYPRWERHEFFRHKAQEQHAMEARLHAQQQQQQQQQQAGRVNRAAMPPRQGRETRAASRERAPSPGPVSHIKVVTRAGGAKTAQQQQQRQAPIVSLRPHQQHQQHSPQRQAIIEAPARKPVKADPATAARTRAAAAQEREYGRHLAMESEVADGPVLVGIRTSGIARLAESGGMGSYGTFTTSSNNKKVAKKQKATLKGAAKAAAAYPKFSPMEYKAMYKMIAIEAALEGKRRMLAAAARALTGDRRPAAAARAAKGLAQQQQQQQRPLAGAAKKAAQPAQQQQQKQQKLSPAAYRAQYKTVAREAARVGAARMAAAMRGERDTLARRQALDHRRNAITRATFVEHLRQGPAATSMMMGGLRSMPIRELYRNLAAEAAEVGAMRSAAWGDARRLMMGQRGYAAPTATSIARQRAAPPQPTQAQRGRMQRRQSSVVVVAPRTARHARSHAHSPYPYVQDTEMEHRTMLQAAELDERDRLLHSAVGAATTRRAAVQRLRDARGRAIAERQAERHRARLAADRSASDVDKFESRRASRQERARPWRRADWASDIVKRHHGGTPLTSYIDLRRTGAIVSPISSSTGADNAEVARTRLPIDVKPMSIVGMHRAAAAAARAAGGMTPLQRRRELQRSRATPRKKSAAEAHHAAAARRADPYHLACSERDEHFHAALLKAAHAVADNGPRMHSEGEAKLRAQNPHLDTNITQATTRTTAAMQGRAQALGGKQTTVIAGKKKAPAAGAKRLSNLYDYPGALNAMRAGDEPYLRLTRRGPAPNAPHPHTFHFEDGVYWNLTTEALRQQREVDEVLAAAAAKQDRVDPLLAATKATPINVDEEEAAHTAECDACHNALACELAEARQREVLARTPLRFKYNTRHCRPRSDFRVLMSKH